MTTNIKGGDQTRIFSLKGAKNELYLLPLLLPLRLPHLLLPLLLPRLPLLRLMSHLDT
jgi:hypothetical protein